MKTRISFIVAFMFICFLSARGTGNETYNQTFVFRNVPAGFDLTDYVTALENSNFECYRFKTQRRTFVFDNGIELELFSALEIQQSTSLTSTCFLEDDTKTPNAILTLGNGNTIIMNVEAGHKNHSSN